MAPWWQGHEDAILSASLPLLAGLGVAVFKAWRKPRLRVSEPAVEITRVPEVDLTAAMARLGGHAVGELHPTDVAKIQLTIANDGGGTAEVVRAFANPGRAPEAEMYIDGSLASPTIPSRQSARLEIKLYYRTHPKMWPRSDDHFDVWLLAKRGLPRHLAIHLGMEPVIGPRMVSITKEETVDWTTYLLARFLARRGENHARSEWSKSEYHRPPLALVLAIAKYQAPSRATGELPAERRSSPASWLRP